MAVVEIKVPVFSESVSEGSLLAWSKKVGDKVSRGDVLIEIETDKVVLEVTALADGVLTQTMKGEGDIVSSEELLGQIDTEATAGAVAAPVAVAVTAAIPVAALSASSAEVPQSPAVRKMAAETGIDPATLEGTGKAGRVTKGDMLEAAAKPAPVAPVSTPSAVPVAISSVAPISGVRPEQRVPMSRIRARIAQRLKEVQNTAAILTTFNEVNMLPIMELRKKYQDAFVKKHGVKLGFMSFFVRAATEALKAFPLVNASIDGNDIIYHGFFDIGIAVSSERGLVVPILRDTDTLNLAQDEKEIAAYAVKAKNGKLTLEDMSGGTFSITNGGTFGSMLSTPILNQPQSAILGMHNIVERPVVENGQIVARPIMYVALSYDHRIIDGKEAVSFLVMVKNLLEDPARLILDL